MVYNIWPYGLWAGYQPDQGYYVQQPATLGQLNRLRSYVEYIRKSVNDWAEQVEGHDDQWQQIEDRLEQAEGLLKEHGTSIADNQRALKQLNTLVFQISDRLETITRNGLVHGVQFTPTDRGWRTTVAGDPQGSQHEVSFESDDSLPMVIDQSNDMTRVKFSVKGGSQDLARLGYSVDDSGIQLDSESHSPRMPIRGLQALSSDGTLQVGYGANNESAYIYLNEGPSLTAYKSDVKAWQTQSEQQSAKLADRMKAQEARGTFDGIETSSTSNGWDIRIGAADTEGAQTGEWTAKLNLLGDETISVTPNSGEPSLMLHAADQLQRLPVLLGNVRMLATDGHIQLIQSGYDPKTGRTVDPQTVGNVGVSGSNTVTVSTTGDGLHVDATPAVDQAKAYTDQELAKLQATVGQLEAKVNGQAQTISNLQTQVAQYKDVADRSVTSASLDVVPAENGDPSAFTLRINLYSKSGASVAVLPAEVRFISEKNTIATGVQINGHTASVELDTK